MKLYAVALAAPCLLTSLFAAGPTVEQKPMVIEEIIAKVNGDIITKGDIEKARSDADAAIRKQGLQGAQLQQTLDQFNKDILRDKIDQLLLVQRGTDLNINVDPEISKYVAEMQKQSKIADPEKFQQLVQQQTGMTYEDWKNEAKNGILTRRVISQEVGSRISVPHKDVEAYYEAHKSEFVRKEQIFLREILVSTDGKDAAGVALAEKKAKDLSTRAKNGEKFAELARDNSDAVTAPAGGDLGTGYEKGQLAKEVEDAVWNQPKGFVTAPMKVSNGFLILKVEEHQKEGQASLEDVQNEIMEKLYSPKMQPAVREYLTKLRTQAFLEIKDGYVDSGAAKGQNTAWMSTAELKPETITKGEVARQKRRKRLLGALPIPGTTASSSSSSK
ncbi:MAG TPA: peptidylprolyl isomerase [Bryobacteraceae bacterium]|jgi:parvulin-like peptidyl-prolyl isomerase|nr:peptidylprolyl isomerase [Bryobacteraceae bacterium]